ncbi:hypothetical protein [Pseudooceanicola sediminis]|uniref:hypothetical protein n=1 Tax=Pseudooceanicola sediminis TaxID=2211117 RepID=UPI0018F41934|nr:hypothetical protein [Pseudooceanicola sediminis]|tara:strand:+ start:207722 stop:207889 length:168 start_codon:yes stop_codon:yes gene_type:complete
MFILAGLVLGAIFGAVRARKRGGNAKDIWQYAAVHAMLFAIIGLFATVILNRMIG